MNKVVSDNASAQAIYKAPKAFEGVAEQIGVCNEDDVQALVDEARFGNAFKMFEGASNITGDGGENRA